MTTQLPSHDLLRRFRRLVRARARARGASRRPRVVVAVVVVVVVRDDEDVPPAPAARAPRRPLLPRALLEPSHLRPRDDRVELVDRQHQRDEPALRSVVVNGSRARGERRRGTEDAAGRRFADERTSGNRRRRRRRRRNRNRNRDATHPDDEARDLVRGRQRPRGDAARRASSASRSRGRRAGARRTRGDDARTRHARPSATPQWIPARVVSAPSLKKVLARLFAAAKSDMRSLSSNRRAAHTRTRGHARPTRKTRRKMPEGLDMKDVGAALPDEDDANDPDVRPPRRFATLSNATSRDRAIARARRRRRSTPRARVS